MGPFRLVSSSIRRRFYRNVATMACFAFITGTILMAGFLVAGAQMSVQAGMDRLGADLVVIPMDPYARTNGAFLTGQAKAVYMNSSVVSDIESTPGVLRASPQVYTGTVYNATWCDYGVHVMGFDPGSDFTVTPLLGGSPVSGLRDDEVVIGHYVRGDVGSTIDVFGQDLTIAGRLERTGLSLDYSVYLNMEGAYALSASSANGSGAATVHPGEVSSVLVKADRSMGADTVLYWISSLNPDVLAYPMSAAGQQMSDQLAATTHTLYLAVAVVIVVSMPLVALVSTMAANERRREIGILRAMGATRSFVFGQVFSEAVLLALIGGVLGAAVSSVGLAALQQAVTDSLRISFMWPSLASTVSEISIALVVAVALAGLAAVWPAYRASRMEPYDTMRRGQN